MYVIITHLTTYNSPRLFFNVIKLIKPNNNNTQKIYSGLCSSMFINKTQLNSVIFKMNSVTEDRTTGYIFAHQTNSH